MESGWLLLPLSFKPRPWFMIARGRLLKYFSLISLLTFSFSVFFRFRLKLECEKLASEKTEMQRHYVMVSETALVTRFVRKWQSHSCVCFRSRIQPQQCSGSHRTLFARHKKGSARNVPEIYGNVEIFSPESSHLCRTHRCLYHDNFSPCRFFCNIISSCRLYLNTWWLFNNHIFPISSRLRC